MGGRGIFFLISWNSLKRLLKKRANIVNMTIKELFFPQYSDGGGVDVNMAGCSDRVLQTGKGQDSEPKWIIN